MRFALTFALLAILVVATDPAGAIGFGDLKKKVEKKAKGKAEKGEDKAADAAENAAEDAVEGALDGEPDEGGKAKSDGAKADPASKSGQLSKEAPKPSGDVAAVSAKYDFIPGDRTLIAESFAALKPGPLPAAWQPRRGTAVVEQVGGERWLAPKGESVVFRIPLDQPLPMKWTLELEYSLARAEGASFRLVAENVKNEACWSASWPQAGGAVSVEGGGVAASGAATGAPTGSHRIAFAVNGAALRVYLDRERALSVPSILPGDAPTSLVLTIIAVGNQPRLAALRLASGPASVKTRLAGGSLATYGVRFDPASDAVRPESAPLFREIASYLEGDAAAKLSIQVNPVDVAGENQKSDRAKKRAAAVRDVLVSQFGISASRLVLGDTDAKRQENPAASAGTAGSPPVVFSRI